MKKSDIIKNMTERSDGRIGVSVSEVLSVSPPDPSLRSMSAELFLIIERAAIITLVVFPFTLGFERLSKGY